MSKKSFSEYIQADLEANRAGGMPTGSIRARRVAAALETRATDNQPDYRDAFEVPTSSTDTRTPEQWARAVFESAPSPVRWFLLLGWRGGCWASGSGHGRRPITCSAGGSPKLRPRRSVSNCARR
jgi:hypothetical protein